jgi:hypothetical protein
MRRRTMSRMPHSPFLTRLRSVPAVVALLLQSCATNPFEEGNRFETSVMASAAWRCADNDFKPVEEQRVLGLETDIRYPNDDVGLELGLFYANREHGAEMDTIDVEAKSYEGIVGGRWKYGRWVLGSRPYAAAGASLQWVTRETEGPVAGESAKGEDWTIGPYFRVGLEWAIFGGLTIAVDYRQVFLTELFHDLDIDGKTTDGNYSQGAIVLGWTF